jgi:hypothetical protein
MTYQTFRVAVPPLHLLEMMMMGCIIIFSSYADDDDGMCE